MPLKPKVGFVYHVKDNYFENAKDTSLRANKGKNHSRPSLFYMVDKTNANIFWMIPLTTKAEKYKLLYEKIKNKAGKCNGIIIGSYDGSDCAFLPQSMFPVTLQYISHVHKDSNSKKPLPVDEDLFKEIKQNAQELRANFFTVRKGETIFTDIIRLKNLMLDELRPASPEKTT